MLQTTEKRSTGIKSPSTLISESQFDSNEKASVTPREAMQEPIERAHSKPEYRKLRLSTGIANTKAWISCIFIGAISLFELHEIISILTEERKMFRPFSVFDAIIGFNVFLFLMFAIHSWFRSIVAFRNSMNEYENLATDRDSIALADEFQSPLLTTSVFAYFLAMAGLCQATFILTLFFN